MSDQQKIEERNALQRSANIEFTKLRYTAGSAVLSEYFERLSQLDLLQNLCAIPSLVLPSSSGFKSKDEIPAISWVIDRGWNCGHELLGAGMSPLTGLRERGSHKPLSMSELPDRLITLDRREGKTQRLLRDMAQWAMEQAEGPIFQGAVDSCVERMAPRWMWLNREGVASGGEVQGARRALFLEPFASGDAKKSGLSRIFQIARSKANADLTSSFVDSRQSARQALLLSVLQRDDAELFDLMAPACGLTASEALDHCPPRSENANWLIAALGSGAWSCARSMLTLGANPWLCDSVRLDGANEATAGNPIQGLAKSLLKAQRDASLKNLSLNFERVEALINEFVRRLIELEPMMSSELNQGGLLAGAFAEWRLKESEVPKALKERLASMIERELVQSHLSSLSTPPSARLGGPRL